MKNIKKTNAIRELDKNKIKYNLLEYEVDENDLSAISVATKTGQDITIIFKTLALITDKNDLIIACIPASDNIDLRKIAKIAGVKRVEMLELKELTKMTGYVRGGCSPIGIKRKHTTFIHSSSLSKEKIVVSAGMRGLQIVISPKDLIELLGMTVTDIVLI